MFIIHDTFSLSMFKHLLILNFLKAQYISVQGGSTPGGGALVGNILRLYTNTKSVNTRRYQGMNEIDKTNFL